MSTKNFIDNVDSISLYTNLFQLCMFNIHVHLLGNQWYKMPKEPLVCTAVPQM